jgi:hypothetical protein
MPCYATCTWTVKTSGFFDNGVFNTPWAPWVWSSVSHMSWVTRSYQCQLAGYFPPFLFITTGR